MIPKIKTIKVRMSSSKINKSMFGYKPKSTNKRYVVVASGNLGNKINKSFSSLTEAKRHCEKAYNNLKKDVEYAKPTYSGAKIVINDEKKQYSKYTKQNYYESYHLLKENNKLKWVSYTE